MVSFPADVHPATVDPSDVVITLDGQPLTIELTPSTDGLTLTGKVPAGTDGIVLVQVPADSYADVAGNPGLADQDNNALTYDN